MLKGRCKGGEKKRQVGSYFGDLSARNEPMDWGGNNGSRKWKEHVDSGNILKIKLA